MRVTDELWQEAKRVASDNGETVTDVINRALRRYVREHPLPGSEFDPGAIDHPGG